MDYSFTLFQPQKERVPKSDEPLVELRPNGRIVFNKKASEYLQNHTFCMLGYDLSNQTIGLLPLPERKTNSFPIRYASKGAYVGAKRFFKHFEILPEQLVENTPFVTGEFIGVKLQ